MRIPYSCVTSHGDVVFAARGGQIQTFGLTGGPALTTWNHPEAEREAVASLKRAGRSAENGEEACGAGTPTVEDEPPTKRQRVEQAVSEESTAEPGTATPQGEESGDDVRGKKKGKKGHGNARGPISRQPDYHLIIILEVSADGKHVAAVSGNDKTLWVFEHDGNGGLRESSKRPMPKRPSGVAISPDNKAIIVADKFGDVYALPLDPTDSLSGLATSLSVKHHRDPLTPAANAHTVHSKINLRSLEMQQRALERRDKAAPKESPKPEEPAFEHTLVLGHVSMLTGVLVREYEGRKYILTSDRDEHIRVSRYLPQNHVIEAFCLGHKEFVNCVAVSEAYPGILVSGGGDDELFVWNWPTGALLSKADILPHARRVGDVQHVAVLKIASSGSSIFAICEGIPAVFQWTLSETHTLDNCRTMRLYANPLDISLSSSSEPSLLIAVNAGDEVLPSEQRHSLLAYSPADEERSSWVPRMGSFDESASPGTVLEISPLDSNKLFYTVENLRKNREQAGEEEDQDA